jgi:hypothetical protein
MPAHNRTAEPEPAHRRKPVGTFVRSDPDGEPVERVAFSASDAVALTFDGWRPKTSTPEPASPTDATAPQRELPRSGTSGKSR